MFKFVILGSQGAGKSCYARCFSGAEFSSSESSSTIVVEFVTRTMHLDGDPCTFQVWDTSGQQKFQSVTKSYQKGAHAIMLAYDASDRKSFESLDNWAKTCQEHMNSDTNALLALLAMKCDKEDLKVTQEEGE